MNFHLNIQNIWLPKIKNIKTESKRKPKRYERNELKSFYMPFITKTSCLMTNKLNFITKNLIMFRQQTNEKGRKKERTKEGKKGTSCSIFMN